MSKECYGGCATDVIVVRHMDGTLKSTPFHIFFGKKCASAVVDIVVNGVMVPVKMKVNERGVTIWNTVPDTKEKKDLPTSLLKGTQKNAEKELPTSNSLLFGEHRKGDFDEIGGGDEDGGQYLSLVNSEEFREFNDSLNNSTEFVKSSRSKAIKEELTTPISSPQLSTIALKDISSDEKDFLREEKKYVRKNSTSPQQENMVTFTKDEDSESDSPKDSSEVMKDNASSTASPLKGKELLGTSTPENFDTIPDITGIKFSQHVLFNEKECRTSSSPEKEKIFPSSFAAPLSSGGKEQLELDAIPLSQQQKNRSENCVIAELPSDKNAVNSSRKGEEEKKCPSSNAVENLSQDPVAAPSTATLTPSHEQLALMSLELGENEVDFIISGKPRGCRMFLYLFDDSDRLIISDVDGTITKSDLMGHACEWAGMGARCLHPGICSFFSDIKENGYHIVYLTARSMYQARSTRKFLWGLHQGRVYLPRGPIFSYPGSFLNAIRQEIWQRSHVFKAHCLKEIKQTFSDVANPFFAAFGNRSGDYVAYSKAGVPGRRIFLLDSRSTVKLSFMQFHLKNIVDPSLLDARFPPRRHRHQMSQLRHPFSSQSSEERVRSLSLNSSPDSGRTIDNGKELREVRETDATPGATSLPFPSFSSSQEVKERGGEVCSSVALSDESGGPSVVKFPSASNRETPTSHFLRGPSFPAFFSFGGSKKEEIPSAPPKGGYGQEHGDAVFRNRTTDSQGPIKYAISSPTTFPLHSTPLSHFHNQELDVDQEYCDNIFWRIDPTSLISKTDKKSEAPSLVSSPVQSSSGSMPGRKPSPNTLQDAKESSVSSGRRFYFFRGKKVDPPSKAS